MHDVAGKNVKDQQEDQRESDEEHHDPDNHVNQAAVIGQPIVRHFAPPFFPSLASAALIQLAARPEAIPPPDGHLKRNTRNCRRGDAPQFLRTG
jgi:hypothetical protein